jgi:hypothetical protein
MQKLGSLLVFLGAGSFLLHFANMDFILVSWVDNWGVNAGNAIRIGMIVVGAILWFAGRQSAARAAAPPQG